MEVVDGLSVSVANQVALGNAVEKGVDTCGGQIQPRANGAAANNNQIGLMVNHQFKVQSCLAGNWHPHMVEHEKGERKDAQHVSH